MFSFQLNLVAGEEVEIDYEVDGWYYVSPQTHALPKLNLISLLSGANQNSFLLMPCHPF